MNAPPEAVIVLLNLNDKLVEKRQRTVDLFRQIDESGDGVVSPDEFRTGLHAFGFSISDEDFKSLMGVLDKDGDGEVDFREFDKAIKKACKMESKASRAKRLSSEVALEPVDGAVSNAYLQSLIEKAKKKSPFLDEFSKEDLTSLIEVCAGTIQFKNGQTILPPGIEARWVGIVLQGTVEMKHNENREKVFASNPIGSLLRSQQYLDGLFSAKKKKKKKKKKKGGLANLVLDLNGGSKETTGSRAEGSMPVRVGGEIVSECPGVSDEVMVGSAKMDGLLCCWNYAAMEFLQSKNDTKDLAIRFLKMVSRAASCELKERFHQKIWIERQIANDDTGLGEAAKAAALNKRLEEIEAEKEKMKVEMEKAKKAIHSAKNDAMLRKRLERKLEDTEKELKLYRKSGAPAEDSKASKEQEAKQKQMMIANVQQIKKLKKIAADEKAVAKRKLESLRKMMTAQAEKKVKAAEKVAAKKTENKIKLATSKLVNKHKIEVAALKEEIAKLRAHLEELELGKAKQQEKLREKEEQARQEKIKDRAKIGWAKLRKQQQDEADARKKARARFTDVMAAAQKNRLESIRDQALKQLEATRLALMKQEDTTKDYEAMLEDAEAMKERMATQVSDLMNLVGAAQAESSSLANQLAIKKKKNTKNKWRIAQEKVKDKQAKSIIAKLQANLGASNGEADSLRKTLAQEEALRRRREVQIAGLEDDLEMSQNETESFRTFAIMLGLRLGLEAKRLHNLWQRSKQDLNSMTLDRDSQLSDLRETQENLAKAHGTISMHVKSGDVLRLRIDELKDWCKRSHRHRKRLEDIVKKFELELGAARDAIWSQSLKNKELQAEVAQMAGDQVEASEVRAVMLDRLKASEQRRLELEQCFSTLARASTPLLNQLKAVDENEKMLMREAEIDEEWTDIGTEMSRNFETRSSDTDQRAHGKSTEDIQNSTDSRECFSSSFHDQKSNLNMKESKAGVNFDDSEGAKMTIFKDNYSESEGIFGLNEKRDVISSTGNSSVAISVQSRQHAPEIDGLESKRGGVILRNTPWISPYLRRKGLGESRKPMKLSIRSRLQRKTLVLLEERELLDPSSNNLMFVGADSETNVMAVMMLERAGYNVKTVINFQKLEQLSRQQGADELAMATDCVLVDLNVVRFSVEYVHRVLGGGHLLGEQMARREIPIVALSTRRSQREQCAQLQGVFFVLKPPKPGPLKLVVRAALARFHNLKLARQKREERGEWSITPDAGTDLKTLKSLGPRNSEEGEIIRLGMSDTTQIMPRPHPLPFPESPVPTPPQTPKSETSDRSSFNDENLDDADYISPGDLDTYGYGNGAGAFGFGSLNNSTKSKTWRESSTRENRQYYPRRPTSGGRDTSRAGNHLRRKTSKMRRSPARPKSIGGRSTPQSGTSREYYKMAALSEAERVYGNIVDSTMKNS